MRYLRLLSLIIGVGLLWSGQASAYANTPSIDPAYNSDIIDDPVFLNSGTMSPQAIQNFLDSKVPSCDTNHQGGLAQYPPPYTCLKDYVDPTTGKKAAQLIYDEATAIGLNPQVILVTLQKEQGLVTDSWPYPSQYKSAMGYGCPESQPVCDSQYYGLYNQVHLGARLLRSAAARSCGDMTTLSSWSDIPAELKVGHTTDPNAAAHRVDSAATFIGSCATGSLYNYTPHRPDSAYTLRNGAYYYGNYNFINYFTSWFGATRVALAKSASQPQIYLVTGSHKLLVPNAPLMIAWNLDKKPVSIVDQSYLDGLTSDGNLTTLAKKDNGSPTLYMIDGQRHFSIPSGQACTDWGLACNDTNSVKTVSAYVIESLTYAGNLPRMFANGGIFQPEAGKKRPVLDERALNILGGYAQVQLMGDLNTTQPQGSVVMVNDTMLKLSPSQAVYLFDGDQLHFFSTPGMVNAWAAGSRPVANIPDNFIVGVPVGAVMSSVVVDSGGTKWLVDGAARYSLTGRELDWPISGAISFGQPALLRLPAKVLKPIMHSNGGAIYTVSAGKKYVFPTFDDFFGLGDKLDQITDTSGQVESLFTYGGQHLAAGRVYKVAGSDAIYVNNGTSSLQIQALQDIGPYHLPAEHAIITDVTTAARYPSAGALGAFFKTQDGRLYTTNGSKLFVSGATATAYGIGTVPILLDQITSRMPTGPDLTQFIKGSSGAIYYISDGQRHYVDTPSKLNSLGGNDKVLDVPDTLINSITLGSPA